MYRGQPKVMMDPQKVIIHPQVFNMFPKKNCHPQNMFKIYALSRQFPRVELMHICRQIHQCPKLAYFCDDCTPSLISLISSLNQSVLTLSCNIVRVDQSVAKSAVANSCRAGTRLPARLVPPDRSSNQLSSSALCALPS